MDRLSRIKAALMFRSTKQQHELIIKQQTTGKVIRIPIHQSKDSYFIHTKQLSKVQTGKQGGLGFYDPALVNTICGTSKICFIDGQKGLLKLRGYPIEELAQKSTYLQVAFLLIHGQLPCKKQLLSFTQNVYNHRILHEDIPTMMNSFRYDAHPMGILISTISAMSTLNPASNPALKGVNIYNDPQLRNQQIYTLLGILPTIAANSYRHRIGRSYNPPHPQMGYVQNLMYMLDRMGNQDYRPHPKLVKALQTLFIIHAQHEMNCSTVLLKHLTSAGSDIYTAVSAAAGALYGTRHGGANAAVIRMLEEIGSISNINKFLMQVKQKKRILFGFGHRVYKSHDPRAKIAKKVAEQVFTICGRQPLVEIARQIQKITADDEYFITRRIYPNVDFYNGLIYRAMGFPIDMYPVLFVLPLLAGWLAHWVQTLNDPETTVYQPKQFYNGHGTRQFIELSERKGDSSDIQMVVSIRNKRRKVAHQFMEGRSY